ncbi:MAG TPA: hypothetical protein VMM12_17395 [Longimicrobiales bacterium]|nr:hypothetical protein [Longimicrobiales bacterium]
MSDHYPSGEHDDADGHDARRPVDADGRDLEIRLSLQVIGGDDGTPVRVRWVNDQTAPTGRAVGGSSTANSARRRNALLLVAGAAALVAATLLGASLFRPGLSPDRQPAAADLHEPLVPPTALNGAGAAAVDAGVDEGAAGAPEGSGAAPVEPPSAAEPTLRIAGDLPANARFYVNGEEVRRRTLSLRAGSYQLEVRAAGFAPARLAVRLAPGDDRTWRPRLDPLSLAQAPPPLETAPAQRIVADAAAVPTPPTRVAAAAPPAIEESAPEVAAEPPIDPARLLEAARADIRSSLDGLVRALQARSIAELRRVYPAMTAEQEKRWRDFLESSDISDLRVTLAQVQPPVVQGDLAEATFDIVLQFRTAYSGAVRQPTRYGATLERRTADWTIRSLEAIR